jgi:hypothetical protein
MDVMAGQIIECLINETIDSPVVDFSIYLHIAYIDSLNLGLGIEGA